MTKTILLAASLLTLSVGGAFAEAQAPVKSAAAVASSEDFLALSGPSEFGRQSYATQPEGTSTYYVWGDHRFTR